MEGGGAEAGTSPLYNGAFVLNPEAGAPLMGLNGALGEALHVLGQHLLLVAVGCISLEVKRAFSLGSCILAAQRGFEWTPGLQPYLSFLQVFYHLLEDGAIVPPGDLEMVSLELISLQLGSQFRVESRV